MARTTKNDERVPHAVTFDVKVVDDVVVVALRGPVNEYFPGFGTVAAEAKFVVMDVSAVTVMTSIGVSKWLKAMDALPKTISALYFVGCPTFFVDQLNMVLNFGGAGKVLTVMAPYACLSCGMESSELIDVVVDCVALARGEVPVRYCSNCVEKLEFDEMPGSYFAFVNKYAATSIEPPAARALAALGLYDAPGTTADKPPKIIKLVHGAVTYFRIIGTIGASFRSRPFVLGAEGDVVIDLAEVEHFAPEALREWGRVLTLLSAQVRALVLVDVDDSFLAVAGDTLAISRVISVWSLLVTCRCVECGRTTSVSQTLENAGWPLHFPDQICPTCGGQTRIEQSAEALLSLRKAATKVPTEIAKLIAEREDRLSRALTDANVAQAGDSATASLRADDIVLGKYRIVRRLSSGGMAEVFVAHQVGIEKPVALKRVRRSLLEKRHLAIEMFLNEAKIAGRLTHPNIVQMLDVGEEAGAVYLAMEYVHGRDLRDTLKALRVKQRKMAIGEACFIVREVAEALHHAFWATDMTGKQLSVVHRDVSPHNIVLSFDGAVKLVDFGVALSAVTEEKENLIVGKREYMSPEHMLRRKIDHRSDLFSLGVVLYLLSTGKMPFSGDDRELQRRIQGGDFRRLAECAPALPAELSELVDSLLAPNPKNRPKTGHEVGETLSAIMRAYGYHSSAASVATTVAEAFPPGEADPTNVLHLVRVKRPSHTIGSPSPSPAPSPTPSLAVGSGRTWDNDSEKRPSRQGLAEQPGQSSRSSGSVPPADVSVALARRSRRSRSSMSPRPDKTRLRNRIAKIAVLTLVVGWLSLAGYLLLS